jgi:SagB-type dehydrogenase family enzyme
LSVDDPSIAAVHRYHDGTKHNYGAFARSLGYLDWASQPRPFRAFAGAPFFPLFPDPSAPSNGYVPRAAVYGRLPDRSVPAEPVSAAAIGDLLRHALGLSAWKELGSSRWSLRVNPSSGNLHPTEAYVVCGGMPGLAATPAVYHYAAERHCVELRCTFGEDAWRAAAGEQDVLLIALTSIHWRESWKYGERAFRYCQHDLGHAIAAVGMSAALAGWRATLLPDWSHRDIATLTGIDRDEDFIDTEREEPGVVIAVGADGTNGTGNAPFAGERGRALADCVQRGPWSGHASQLSVEHVEWTFIEDVARATQTPGVQTLPRAHGELAPAIDHAGRAGRLPLDARTIFKQRRSAVAFDGVSSTDRSTFMEMLSRVMPGAAPWEAAWWTPRIHLALFVHRVNGVAPGLYMLVREAGALERLRAACGRDFLWEAVPAEFGEPDPLPLYCLVSGDCRRLAARLSCDQDIAADGFFSLGMIADFDRSLEEYGAFFYRNLFWEAGAIGQTLYLEAEAAGARATGIGCFYDDPVHDVLGLQGHAFQSLYHFTVGVPVDDARLTTSLGYAWERTG